VRAVLDTNVVVSALLWGGIPERLIEFAGEGALELFTSEALLAARADLIVSGDEDLRALKIYRHIRIVSAAEALSIVSVA
jgi:predicted nucleic acid-binding protein